MKLRSKIGFGVLAVMVGLMIWPAAAHYRMKARVQNHKRHLADRGEKLTAAELAPVPPAETVAALQRLSIISSALGNGPTSAPPSMVSVTNGTAIVSWQQAIYPTEEVSNAWVMLDLEFSGKEEKLAELREVLQAERLTPLLDYSQNFSMLLPHLSRIKTSAQWLNAGVLRDLHDGAADDAYVNLRALVKLGQGFDGDITMVGVLVRVAVCAISMNACWAALQSPDLTSAQWEEIQGRWERLGLWEHAELALGMERVMGQDLLRQGRYSYAVIGRVLGSGNSAAKDLANLTSKVLEEPAESWRGFSHRFPGYWRWKLWGSYEDELVNSLAIQIGIDRIRQGRQEPTGAALLGIGDEVDRLAKEHPKAGKWLGMSLASDGLLQSFSARLLDFEIQRKLLVTAIALKRYELEQGRPPATLEQLSPDFLAKTPLDLDGQPLRLVVAADEASPLRGWKLYSVGIDLKDDGGMAAPARNAPSDLRRWWRWKDAVWPQPAGQPRVDAYFDYASRKRLEKK